MSTGDIPYDIYSDFNSVKRTFNRPQYPAGIYDYDKADNMFAKPSSEYPTLALPYDIYDEDGNVLLNGFYTLALSPSRKKLCFIQTNKVIAEVPVIKLIEKMQTKDETEKEASLEAKIIQMKERGKRKDKIMEVEEELKAIKERRQYSAKAEIHDDNNGYYSIKYEMGIIKAYAVIKKYGKT